MGLHVFHYKGFIGYVYMHTFWFDRAEFIMTDEYDWSVYMNAKLSDAQASNRNSFFFFFFWHAHTAQIVKVKSESDI